MSNTNPTDAEGESQAIKGIVVPFVRRRRVEPAEPFMTDAERKELREMMVFLRAMRPQFQTLVRSCPMARRLLEDES